MSDECRIVLPAAMRCVIPMVAPDDKESRYQDIQGCRITVTDDGFRAEATDGRYAAIYTGPAPAVRKEGRFPPLDQVVSALKPPVASVAIRADALAQLLMSAGEVSLSGVVMLSVRAGGEPVTVRAIRYGSEAAKEETFLGILMPCTEPTPFEEEP